MYTKQIRHPLFFIIILFVFLLLGDAECFSKEYSPNVHWTFCIDTSGSMKEKGQLNLLRLVTDKLSKEFISEKNGIIKPGDRITLFSFDRESRLEASVLYQTQNDLSLILEKLESINKHYGMLTFTSEVIV